MTIENRQSQTQRGEPRFGQFILLLGVVGATVFGVAVVLTALADLAGAWL